MEKLRGKGDVHLMVKEELIARKRVQVDWKRRWLW